jgi:hypothetical protein
MKLFDMVEQFNHDLIYKYKYRSASLLFRALTRKYGGKGVLFRGGFGYIWNHVILVNLLIEGEELVVLVEAPRHDFLQVRR